MFLLLTVNLALAAKKPAAPVGPPCLAEATTALAEAGPASSAKAWLEVANCDAEAGKAAAPEAWKKIISGPGADAAGVKALELGLGEGVRAWVATLQPDEKSGFISALGDQCANAAVPAFFAESVTALGGEFWGGRWYAGLSGCHVPGAVAILEGGLESQRSDRIRFKAILETLARNQGKDALPRLQKGVAGEADPELASYWIGAFADAAGVGSVGGLDVAAAEAAAAAIRTLAPTLPELSLATARTTLLALNHEADSDAMAAHRYRSLAQEDGTLMYGLYVKEIATCKKDTRAEVHTAMVTNAGRTWPDQVAARVQGSVNQYKWHFPKDCTGEVVVVASPTPLKSKADFEAFVLAQDQELQKKNPDVKAKAFGEAPIVL
jgi:hypothetical protein